MTKFRKTAENLWYHYKVQILLGLFLIGALLLTLYSCFTRQKYDLQIYYVAGNSRIYKEQEVWIEQAVSSLCPDVDGDGTVRIAVTALNVGPQSDPSERAEWMNAVNAGEVLLFFADEAGITYLYENGYLQPLNDFSDELWAADCAWEVTGSSFSKSVPGFDLFDETTVYAALRIQDGTWSSGRRKTKVNYDTAVTVLHSIVDYKTDSE